MATNYQAAIRTASERKPRHRSIPLKLDIDLSSIPRRDKESPIAADESTRNKLRNMNAEGEVDALPDFPQIPAHWASSDCVWVTEPTLNAHIAGWLPSPKAPKDVSVMISEFREASDSFAEAIEAKKQRQESEEEDTVGAENSSPTTPQSFMSILFQTPLTSRAKSTAAESSTVGDAKTSRKETSRRSTVDGQIHSLPIKNFLPLGPLRVSSFSAGCPVATNKKLGMLDALRYYTVRRIPRILSNGTQSRNIDRSSCPKSE